MLVELTSPFPPDRLPDLWAWLNEFPDANFDDYGERDFQAFEAAMLERAKIERSWGVTWNGDLCGAISLLPLTPDKRLYCTHGIVFAQRVHHTGVAQHAVRAVLDQIFAEGAEKIAASFFNENHRIERFLSRLGFLYEGVLRKHTLQHGEPVAMRMMAIFKS